MYRKNTGIRVVVVEYNLKKTDRFGNSTSKHYKSNVLCHTSDESLLILKKEWSDKLFDDTIQIVPTSISTGDNTVIHIISDRIISNILEYKTGLKQPEREERVIDKQEKKKINWKNWNW